MVVSYPTKFKLKTGNYSKKSKIVFQNVHFEKIPWMFASRFYEWANLIVNVCPYHAFKWNCSIFPLLTISSEETTYSYSTYKCIKRRVIIFIFVFLIEKSKKKKETQYVDTWSAHTTPAILYTYEYEQIGTHVVVLLCF